MLLGKLKISSQLEKKLKAKKTNLINLFETPSIVNLAGFGYISTTVMVYYPNAPYIEDSHNEVKIQLFQ